MRRIVCSPRWVAGTLLTLAAIAACVLLGIWQLDRARSSAGSLQNAGYALQWPLFAVFFAFLWLRTLRLELQVARDDRPPSPPVVVEDPTSPFVARRRGPSPAVESDPELTAYNQMLAGLAARDRRAPQ